MKRTYHTYALTYAFTINTLLTIIEYAAGSISGSAAILADASQNLTDSLVLTIAFICERLVGKQRLNKPARNRIYQITGALNAAILICLSYSIGFLAINRIIYPHPPASGLVICIGILSVIINGWAAGLLFTARHDRATRAPFTGLLFSGLSGVGVLASGIVYHFWHVSQIDGITGVVIAILLLIRSTRLLASSIPIFKP